MHLFCLSCCLTLLTAEPEILCERTQFGMNSASGRPASFPSRERTSDQEQERSRIYGLCSITVSPGGWQVDAVAIYTQATQPEEWLKVRRARFNLIPKKGDRPAAEDDPRRGREVEVSVRRVRDDVYEVRAAGLALSLTPGEYWLGLTPIYTRANGDGFHLTARGARDARFDDVVRAPDSNEMPMMRNWVAIGPGIYAPLGEHLSIRIEGRANRRGRLLDWPTADAADKKSLHLRFATFDPLAGTPEVPAELTAGADNRLWIVQWRATVNRQARDHLAQADASLLRYLPDDAYLVRLAPDRVPAVRKLAGVRWVGPYHPAYRIDANVAPEPLARPSFGDKVPKKELPGVRQVTITVFDRDAETKKRVAQAVRDAGGKVVFTSPHGFYVAADLPRERIAAVAGCDDVCGIERRFEAFENHQAPAPGGRGVLTLAQVRELCGADAVKQAGGYEGLDVRVAFWDDRVREDHVDLLARPLTVLGPTWWNNANHGTAVASILCGEGRGDTRARGLLPLGGLVFAADRGDPGHEDRYGLVERFVREYHAALLSSSSSNWGGGPFIRHYDGYAQLLDDLVQEYDLLVCQAIGNISGSGQGDSGSWAKNALLVGGVNPRGSVRREDHRHGTYASGPALDGRVKPDLVHFGANVLTADASSPRGYAPFGGTSCATPLTAGLCGLMMEMWADGVFGNLPPGKSVFDRKPHAAMARALMINSAYRYPIPGPQAVFTRFRQGWGMADLGRLYAGRQKTFLVDHETDLTDRQAIEYRLHVAEGEPELRVTLAWTDPLGTTTAVKTLVNDLDLVVIAPDGKRYLGNVGLLEGNVSRDGGEADRVNNVENVFLEKPAAGVWRVVVVAHRIGWERPGKAARGQDFALVVCGVER